VGIVVGDSLKTTIVVIWASKLLPYMMYYTYNALIPSVTCHP
jgi:hypothetical protein